MGKATKRTSQTRKIRVHADALRDIANINNYIGVINQQPLNAIKVNTAIEDVITKIELNPFAYKECEEIPTKTKIYRKAVCLSWSVIYRITGTEIVILAVIHGAQNPSKLKGLRKRK